MEFKCSQLANVISRDLGYIVKFLFKHNLVALDDNASECEGNVRVQAKQNVKK